MGDAIIETIEHSKRVSKLVEILRDDLTELYKYYNKNNIDNETIYKSLYRWFSTRYRKIYNAFKNNTKEGMFNRFRV